MIGSNIETNPGDPSLPPLVHDLLREAFASMEGRIDPPSSLTTMTLEDVAAKMAAEDVFLIREAGHPIAVMFGHSEGSAYEIGKLAVAGPHLRQGLARRLIDAAGGHARACGHSALQLYARVELVENHAVYGALGFTQTADFTHAGFDRPTAFIFSRPL